MSDKEKIEKLKKPNFIKKWWRETNGELRKVSWPTTQDAWRLTRIVLIIVALMSMLLGLLDYIFSVVITGIVA